MPKVVESARTWELSLSEQFGKAVASRRKALGLTAVQLSEQTAELGYPISRIAVSKIENNARVGKIDVAEVLVLARALEVPPVLLLYPDYPRGEVEFLPGAVTQSEQAVRWLAGEESVPVSIENGQARVHPGNPGIELIRLVHARVELIHEGIRAFFSTPDPANDEAVREHLDTYTRDKADFDQRIEALRRELWGSGGG